VVITATGPNYCTIKFSSAIGNIPANSNVTVGAIFNEKRAGSSLVIESRQ